MKHPLRKEWLTAILTLTPAQRRKLGGLPSAWLKHADIDYLGRWVDAPYRRLKVGETFKKDDEVLRASGGSCCLPGGWFPVSQWSAGEYINRYNIGHGARRFLE